MTDLIGHKTTSVPCLHRIHVGEPVGALSIHASLGLSIEFGTLFDRLDRLEWKARTDGCAPRSRLITFDDGWSDVMMLVPHFESWAHLQPVLFLTLLQLEGDQSLLPLPRIYDWCATTGNTLTSLEREGISRAALKRMPEKEQHRLLDERGVPRVIGSREVLALEQIADLAGRGWLVASHGHEHFDLRQLDNDELAAGLGAALSAALRLGGTPWIAWPEGRCCSRTCDVAATVGFELQFSLTAETKDFRRADLISREIYR